MVELNPTLDLDVNENGTLTDAVDGVANFLPVYCGNEVKLTPNERQQVRVIVNGLSPGTTVEFRLVNTSKLPGIASNFNSSAGTYPSDANALDYVFGAVPAGATRLPAGQITGVDEVISGVAVDANGCATIPLWVRDFGGRTVVQVLQDGLILNEPLRANNG